MEVKDCIVGTRVAAIDKGQPCFKGTIKSDVEADKKLGHVVIVEWGNRHLQKVDIRELITEAEGFAQDEYVRSEQNRLEREFEHAQFAVTVKMKEAADAINAAVKLAKEKGSSLQDMYSAVVPLMDALDNAGWNTSSFSC